MSNKKWSPLKIYVNERTGKWYWCLTARNGNIVADGAEGYSSEAKAKQGFRAAAKLAREVASE